MNSFTNLARWAAVIPAAAAAYGLMHILLVIMPIPAFVAKLIGSWICPFLFVMAGAVTAPSRRFAVALSLGAVIVAYFLRERFFGLTTEPIWYWLLTCSISLTAIFSASRICWTVQRDHPTP